MDATGSSETSVKPTVYECVRQCSLVTVVKTWTFAVKGGSLGSGYCAGYCVEGRSRILRWYLNELGWTRDAIILWAKLLSQLNSAATWEERSR
jgi:hypothetical protein